MIKRELVTRKIVGMRLREKIYRRRYFVPNAVTVGNMFCGFLAITYAATGRFDKAALAIGIAILLDGLDGRVARGLNATSKFGVEFDSFSDLVSFGVAPAILVYHWAFYPGADSFGVLIAFLYALCAAGRLARFNISSENLKSFTGLPSPGAAGLVAAAVNFYPQSMNFLVGHIVSSLLLLVPAYLMISRVEFLSIKQMRIRRRQVWFPVLMGLIMALIWYNAGLGFLVLAMGYALSGPLMFLLRNRTELITPVEAGAVEAAIKESPESATHFSETITPQENDPTSEQTTRLTKVK